MGMFGKILGGLGKSVGKLALSEAGSLTGTTSFINGNTFDHKGSATSQASIGATSINSPTGGVAVSTGVGLLTSIETFFQGTGEAGHAIANGTATVNGRVAIGDAAGGSGLPSWLLPAGAAVLVLALVMGGRKN